MEDILEFPDDAGEYWGLQHCRIRPSVLAFVAGAGGTSGDLVSRVVVPDSHLMHIDRTNDFAIRDYCTDDTCFA